MENPHQRKKEPEMVRQRILENAMILAAQKGVSGISIQAVADLSGITKGGVFHHFSNKQKLLTAMVEVLFERLDYVVDQIIQQDPHAYGCFTRAYIETTLEKNIYGLDSLWSAICMTMLTDRMFNQNWLHWLEGRLAQHQTTDTALELKILRLAADGIWLVMLTQTVKDDEIKQLKQELIQRSYKN